MAKTIKIKDEYYETFAERAPEKGFDTAEEYVDYVLGQIHEKLQRQGAQDEPTYSKEEEAKVKDRLRSLGYLD